MTTEDLPMTFNDPFTKDLQLGDFITSYHVGIHRVTKIERRFRKASDVGRQLHDDGTEVVDGEQYNAFIRYEAVLDGSFKPAARRKKGCDSGFCTKITADYIGEQRQEFDRRIKVLEELLLPTNESRDYCSSCKSAYRQEAGCRICDQCGCYGPDMAAVEASS